MKANWLHNVEPHRTAKPWTNQRSNMWLITADFVGTPKVPTIAGNGPSVGVMGPRGISNDDIVRLHCRQDITRFILLDDDNNVYFCGIMDANTDPFAPLDDYGRAFGCTEIRVQEFGSAKWEVV